MLHAALCHACGHQFRTRFVLPPLERSHPAAIVIVPPVAAIPVRRNGGVQALRPAFLSSFLVVALGTALLWLGWTDTHQPLLRRAAASTTLTGSLPIGAEGLYQSVGMSMSLYDLDQTAGRTGRVIPGTDPHTLLLAYDYPHRSVHVSLNRTDTSIDDYRVQAVALYQGKALLRQRADRE